MNKYNEDYLLDKTLRNIPDSIRFAILLPTVRWSNHVRSLLGSLVGVANEEVAILIGDNSENIEKKNYLKKINAINPYIFYSSHEKNIGAINNFLFLHDWCAQVEFSAIVADDDWMTPTYHIDAFDYLKLNCNASGCSTGTTFVDIGDGNTVNVNQSSMIGHTAIQRMRNWNAVAARVTMHNASRRSYLEPAIEYMRRSPLKGITLFEDLWELSRLANGSFYNLKGQGIYLHYPATRAIGGGETERFYNLICKDDGLAFHFVYFASLSTAVQCALFLLGKFSPLNKDENKQACAQLIFNHIFTNQFLPNVTGSSSQDVVGEIFKNHATAMNGYLKYCINIKNSEVLFDIELLNWFISIIRVFEEKASNKNMLLSDRFTSFVNEIFSSSD
jgi:hypothetical protein